MSVITAPQFAGDIISTSLTDLEHAIFTIFNSGKFHLPCAGAHTVVQLLAHFEAQALHLTHTLMVETPIAGPRGIAVFPEPRSSAAALSEEEQERAISELAVVVSHLDIAVKPLIVSGSTYTRPERLFRDHPGRGCTIAISTRHLESINEAFKNENVMAQQYWMFSLARLLFHEIAHALTLARLPKYTKGHCFLGNEGVTTEVGFELENRIFGGIISDEDGSVSSSDPKNHLDFVIVQNEWPDPLTLDQYKVRTFALLTRGPPTSRLARCWKVPFSYINRMFQDKFWGELAENDGGPDGLKCYPMVGYFLNVMPMPGPKNPETPINMVHVNPSSAGAAEFVPIGFEAERKGGLMRRVVDGAEQVLSSGEEYPSGADYLLVKAREISLAREVSLAKEAFSVKRASFSFVDWRDPVIFFIFGVVMRIAFFMCGLATRAVEWFKRK